MPADRRLNIPALLRETGRNSFALFCLLRNRRTCEG